MCVCVCEHMCDRLQCYLQTRKPTPVKFPNIFTAPPRISFAVHFSEPLIFPRHFPVFNAILASRHTDRCPIPWKQVLF